MYAKMEFNRKMFSRSNSFSACIITQCYVSTIQQLVLGNIFENMRVESATNEIHAIRINDLNAQQYGLCIHS